METTVTATWPLIFNIAVVVLLYIIPMVICVSITIVTMTRSFFRNIGVDKFNTNYVYPMSVGEFIKRMFWSYVPIMNVVLIFDFISKYRFYKKFGSSIQSVLERTPHISDFKCKK